MRDAPHIPWRRILLSVVALFTPFLFPWQLAALFTIFITLFVPIIAIPVGVLFDTLYYGSYGFPYFTIAGIVLAIAAYFVQQFVKTRIM